MKINFEGLGYREKWRLLQFVYMIEYLDQEINHNYDYGYDLKVDEPYIVVNAFSVLYATDYGICYDAHNTLIMDNGYDIINGTIDVHYESLDDFIPFP